MASASPTATQSSRSATTFCSFLWNPFPRISLLASSLFASMSPCSTSVLNLFALGAFTSCSSIVCVFLSALGVLLFFVARKREKKKGEKSKRKEEKGEKSCFFDLCVWAFGVAAFLFLLSPKHSSFLSLPCLLSLSFSSLLVTNTRTCAIISCNPNLAPWENALAKALARLKTWSKRNLSIHNHTLIVCTMILPTVDHVLSAAPAPTHALCLLEKNITQFLWDGADGNRRRPMVDHTTLARPHIHGGLNCPLVKHIADSRRVALWTLALYSTEDWACALKKRVLDETGVNGTAFLHKCIPCTNHAQQIIAAFK